MRGSDKERDLCGDIEVITSRNSTVLHEHGITESNALRIEEVINEH